MNDQQLTYGELLEKTEWRERRAQIFLRDHYKCAECNIKIDDADVSNRILNDNFYIKVVDFVEDEIFGQMKRVSFRHLQVHHKFYILDAPPWNYPDEALITLCDKCHQTLHENIKVPVYKQEASGLQEIKVRLCGRCNGSGWFLEYKKIQNGICFECRGSRFFPL